MTHEQETDLMRRYLERLNFRSCLFCTECGEQIGLLDFEFDEPAGWFPHRSTCSNYTVIGKADKKDNTIEYKNEIY